jgi:hypothetical protein
LRPGYYPAHHVLKLRQEVELVELRRPN